jgi:signal transduction histidine kinase
MISRTRFNLSTLLLGTLVEILDLNDHEVAEKVKLSATVTEFKNNVALRGIYLELEDSLWERELLLDESKSKQILRNLLTNALKYRKSRVDLKIDIGRDCLQIAVRDDGEGIPADYHRRIFECYFQLDAKNSSCVRGHGLGLAGVQVLLEDMGGQLFLDSDVGKGATFLVKIPF